MINAVTYIFPDWYFVCFYTIAKTIVFKWLGAIIFLISIYILLLLCELWTLKGNWVRLMLASRMWFASGNIITTYAWIYFILEQTLGALMPHEMILFSGRVLTFGNTNVSWEIFILEHYNTIVYFLAAPISLNMNLN